MKLEVRTLDSVEKIIDMVSLTEQTARKVAVRSLNETARWLRASTSRELAKATGVPSSFLKRRFFVRKARAAKLDTPVTAILSVNLYDVRAKNLGHLQQLARGGKAGKFMFDGSFIATMSTRREVSLYKRKGRERFPVAEMGVEIRSKAQPILNQKLQEVPAIYEKRFQHHLQYELSKTI